MFGLNLMVNQNSAFLRYTPKGMVNLFYFMLISEVGDSPRIY